MKKLIIFLGLILMSAAIFAQHETGDTVDSKTLRQGVTFYEYTGADKDTVGTDLDTLYFEVLTNKNCPLSVNARVEATKVSTTEQFGMILEGKIFKNGTYVKIDSINSGTAAGAKGFELNEQVISLSDTSGVATQLSGTADNFYRYFRIVIGNDDDCTIADRFAINAILWKFYER